MRSRRFTCVVYVVNLTGEESADVAGAGAAQDDPGMLLSSVSLFVY